MPRLPLFKLPRLFPRAAFLLIAVLAVAPSWSATIIQNGTNGAGGTTGVLGAGVESLVFTVEIGGVLFLQQSFDNANAARDFFDDTVLSLGVVSAEDIEVAIRTSTAGDADGFQLDFLLMAAVPEPGTGSLLCLGLVWLARCRKSRRSARPAC